ncbi:MAG TPA: WYL domain-containing protein [Homoserinimonas sp.]|nr:WYL domain-containing protein [Homoserinimonas sp.]
MSDTTTTSRVLALLNLLQTHRHWSGTELAHRLGVTARTLRRDVDRLRELGYRVGSAPGSGGGYQLEAGAALPPLLLTDDEAVTMAIGLRVAATQGLTDGRLTTLTALAKLEQVLPAALRSRVNALAAHVQPMVPDLPAVSPEVLGQLALACRDRDRIRFHYTASTGDESDRLVEPHSLVASQRYWFLVCWDLRRDDWRTFRVDRLERFFNTRVRFESRELPVEDAAEFVSVAVASVKQRLEADIILRLPLEEMKGYFGPWARGATAVDHDRTRWPIGGRTPQELMTALAWVPEGVEYELVADETTRAFVGEAAQRMLQAARR